jgi:hypothetical protein
LSQQRGGDRAQPAADGPELLRLTDHFPRRCALPGAKEMVWLGDLGR